MPELTHTPAMKAKMAAYQRAQENFDEAFAKGDQPNAAKFKSEKNKLKQEWHALYMAEKRAWRNGQSYHQEMEKARKDMRRLRAERAAAAAASAV